MDLWEKRLHAYEFTTTKTTRFDETFLQLQDVHGLQLELVERQAGPTNNWEFNGVTSDVAIKGFGGAVLYSVLPGKSAETLGHVMGLEKIADNGEFIRFQSSGELGNVIDVKWTTSKVGTEGVGTVHHIAWRAKNDADQLDWQQHVGQNVFHVTPVHDRNYFNAIYFREKGRILFEFATDPPGFAHDESFETMGDKLMLPDQYEQYRAQLEQSLQQVYVREIQPNKKGDK